MTLRRMLRIVFSALLPLVITGCAGLKSTQADPSGLEGVAYYMPMRAFILTVKKLDSEVTELNWDVSPSLPDLRQAYSLNFNPHWIGKTKITVAVGPSGLLGMANTSTTSSIAELAKVQSTTSTARTRKLEAKDKCPATGTFVFYIFAPTDKGEVCDGKVMYEIKPIPLTTGKDQNRSDRPLVSALSSGQGVFYRMDRPYTASAWTTSNSQLVTRLLSVPNESPTMYLPFGRTLFAANDAKVTLTEGVMNKYEQDDEGELVALLQFPAKILGAYFSAVGNIFSAFSKRDTEEAKLKLQELKLNLFANTLAKCQAALDKDDKAALDALSCDKLSLPP